METQFTKSVRFDNYLLRTSSNDWKIDREVDHKSTAFFLNTMCKDKCVEDCLSSDWMVYVEGKWINDDKLTIECNDESVDDVDPCKEKRPLEIANSSMGVISSSNIRNQHENLPECEWHINVNVGNVIKITVLELDIEYGTGYLSIYDGEDLNSLRIRTFSGNLSSAHHTIFSTGPNIYIRFEMISYSRLSKFRIRYEGEECDWSDWEIGECSRTCGGGQQTKVRMLHNVDQNDTNCGPISLMEPCNLQSCTDPICQKLQLTSATNKFPTLTFTLQNLSMNARQVYLDSKQNVYLYSLAHSLEQIDGSWLVGLELGSDIAWIFNVRCKGAKTPEKCDYGWLFFDEKGWKLDSTATITCNHLTGP